MENTVEKILEKILLPVSIGWEISGVSINEEIQEIYVELKYVNKTVIVDSVEYPIYDHRKERFWRHLDLWEYKTFLRARVPRYKHESGVKTIEVPWVDQVERMTYLLEKKR
jgi:transposase